MSITTTTLMPRRARIAWGVGFALLAIAPFIGVYPVFAMKALCFAIFACAFNLLLGYAGLMSFGHAMFFGMAGYFFGHVVKVWDLPPEVGLIAGVAGAIAVARLIQSLLFNVTALDPMVYTAVVLLFSAVAAMACLIPSWRASRIDPVVALQQ